MVNVFNKFKVAALVAAASVSPSIAPAQDQQQGVWATSCVSYQRNSPAQCNMNHVVTVQETGQVLFNVTLRVAITDDQPPFLDIIGPLGFYLPNGVTLSVDGVELFNLPIQRCDTNGCFAGVVVSDEDMAQLEAGNALTMRFSPKPDQDAEVDISLAGFTTAYNLIRH